MPEPSQNKLVKKKFQKKVTDPYGKCEPANIKPWAKQHGEGALGPYAAQPHAVCQPKEDSIPQFPRPGPASFLSLPVGIPLAPRRHPWRDQHLQKGTKWGQLFVLGLPCWGGLNESCRLGGS